MSEILKADKVKPKFDEVSKIWADMLSDYYGPDGELKPGCVVETSCPNCGGTGFEGEFKVNGFRHLTCPYCRVVYVSPHLKPEFLHRLYSDEYYSEMYAKSMIPVFEKRKELIGRRKCDQVTSYVAGPGRVLDVGCGIGEVIDVFKDRGWDCEAIEMNRTALKWVRDLGVNVFDGPLSEYPADEIFDVVMAWGVVEHVDEPHAFLSRVLSHLRPGGVFVSEVPSGQCLLVDYCRRTSSDPGRIILGEQHIILFSLEAYEEMHLKAGFEKLHVQTNGLDVETIFKIRDESVSDQLVFDLQAMIDSYGKGDLIRGFWRKPL